MENEQVSLRKLEPSDINFIYATMLRGLYYGSDFYGSIEKSSFFKYYEQVLLRILSKPTCNVVIACLSDEPDAILGYAILEHKMPLLHYCFVKEAWRQRGIARLITQHSEITTVTHITDLGNSIRKQRKWAFDPFLI